MAQPALGSQPSPGFPGNRNSSKTTASVSCKRPRHNKFRCTMEIRRGAGISGIVAMRITRGRLVVARGHGHLRRGKATLTMRVLRPMTPGRYTVTMVVTRATIKAKMVLRLS